MKKIQKALISVFYKDKIDTLALQLFKNGVEIISTGGTQKYLENLGIKVTPAEELTTYPSILGGRVKTLHPAIFGGILNRSNNESDIEELSNYKIPNIDLIWVDLYPFDETVEQTEKEQEIIEKIDIGGISLIRAAAKNYTDKLIISHSSQINDVATHLENNSLCSDIKFRKKMATKAFRITMDYDKSIGNYFGYGKPKMLRYGENPHQTGYFEGNLDELFEQKNGKALSYNNLLDINAGFNLLQDFSSYDGCTFAILKHNNACGLANRKNVLDAYKDALAADPISAFGGVLLSSRKINRETAEELNKLFFEIIIAPDYDVDALMLLKSKKNRIILELKNIILPSKQTRSLLNGNLVQDWDSLIDPIENFKTVTKSEPSIKMLNDLHFANILVKNTKSNAIILVKNNQLLASGTGQTSRVDALNQAIHKAEQFGFDLEGAVMASDAFFPFPDCVEIAQKVGVNAVIQPGGSIKDHLSIEYCDNHSMVMVTTNNRHFKH